MVGSFRFFLAILVVVCHLAGIAGGLHDVAHVGYFAVFGFYVLSGYFISKVLRETYNFRFVPFFTNRILRLYPQYYVVAAFTVLVVTLVQKPIVFQMIRKDWTLSSDAMALVSNLLIFPFPFVLPGDGYVLVPQVWSIGIEILCYGLLWLVIARRPHYAITIAAAAIFYDVVTYALGCNWGARYFLLPAALLPFSIGSFLSWHADWRARIKETRIRKITAFAFAAWAANLALAGFITPVGTDGFDAVFFLNLALAVPLIFFLVDPRLRPQAGSLDRFLGKLSYPVFLTHWIIGFIIRRVFLFDIPFGKLGWALFLESLPLILIVSYGLVLIQDYSVDPIRRHVRHQAAHAGAWLLSRVQRQS